MKKRWLRGVIGGLSFTSALFIFQACYGMGPDMVEDRLVEGKVIAKSTGLPIKNIQVIAVPDGYGMQTNEKGEFAIYAPASIDRVKLTFDDIDSTENGSFQSTDTIISTHEILNFSDRIYVNVTMEEK